MCEEVKLLFNGGINLFFFFAICMFVCMQSLSFIIVLSYVYIILSMFKNTFELAKRLYNLLSIFKDPKVIEISIIRLNSSFLMTCLFFLTAHAPWIWPLHASDGRPAVTDGAGALPPTRRGGPPRTTTTRPHPTTPTQW